MVANSIGARIAAIKEISVGSESRVTHFSSSRTHITGAFMVVIDFTETFSAAFSVSASNRFKRRSSRTGRCRTFSNWTWARTTTSRTSWTFILHLFGKFFNTLLHRLGKFTVHDLIKFFIHSFQALGSIFKSI